MGEQTTAGPARATGRMAVLLGGGLLLVCLWLAAPAFACTPQATISELDPPAAPADSPVRVTGERFDPEGEAVAIRWGSPDGPVLGMAALEDDTFTHTITVPTDASAGRHALYASQQRDGQQVGEVIRAFEVQPDPDPEHDGCPEGRASFTDRAAIPLAHRANVDCAAGLDIVHGFAGGAYEPQRAVRRDQMASLVARSLEAAGVTLPAPAEPRFRDVAAGSAHDDAIHRLSEAGIVHGGPGDLPADSYGPHLAVRRDQMASFLLRAAEFADGQDRSSESARFADVGPDNAHFARVNGAAQAGLAQGFADGTYRPAAGIRRDQMASFVVRLLDVLAGGDG